jgi:hypothetical protein
LTRTDAWYAATGALISSNIEFVITTTIEIKIVVKNTNSEMCTRFQSKDSIPLTKARLLNFPRNSPAFQQFLYDWNSVEKTALSLDGTAAV